MESVDLIPPKHVAVIMDGNGRWAQGRSHPRAWGHIRGTFRVSEIVQAASDCGVKALTLYSFSTENWGRPTSEVKTLFKLLKKFLIKERNRILKNKIKFEVIGDISRLPAETISLVKNLEVQTQHHSGLKLNIAFGYGSKKEIVDGVNKWISLNPGEPISENIMNDLLLTKESGDVDLLIRTGGDKRISNFLLWQCAYAEFYFTNTPWPNFEDAEFINILKNFSTRERRFGRIESEDKAFESGEAR